MKRGVDRSIKTDSPDRWRYLSPAALMILCDFILYCELYGLDCTVTDTVSTQDEDDELKRLSATHRTGRAFDASLRKWTSAQAEGCALYFSEKYKTYAAVDPNGNRKLVKIHDAGTGQHLHFQVHTKYAEPVFMVSPPGGQ